MSTTGTAATTATTAEVRRTRSPRRIRVAALTLAATAALSFGLAPETVTLAAGNCSPFVCGGTSNGTSSHGTDGGDGRIAVNGGARNGIQMNGTSRTGIESNGTSRTGIDL